MYSNANKRFFKRMFILFIVVHQLKDMRIYCNVEKYDSNIIFPCSDQTADCTRIINHKLEAV